MKRKFPLKFIAAFCITVFLIIMLTLLIMGSVFGLLYKLGVFEFPKGSFILAIAFISVVLSTSIAAIAGKKVFAPIKELNAAMKSVAGGNFHITLTESGNIEEIRDMAQNFNIMTKELASMEMIHSDFTQNVSHEFKTPLSTIEGYATLMQSKQLSDEKRLLYASKIIDSSKRLSTLTGNILELSKLEHQQIALERKLFFLDEQLRQVILLQEEKCNQQNLLLDVDLQNVLYNGNEEMLFQVWENIFGNAMKFSSPGGNLCIFLEQTEEKQHESTSGFIPEIKVSITDNGKGMSSEIQKRIFEKFYQGDKSHSGAGNGLGLALAKQIVELHDGTISVTSEEGKGSTFTVILPVLES